MEQFGIKEHHNCGCIVYSLDRQTKKSEYIGDYPNGRPMFDTERTEIGEAVYKLKNNADISQVDFLAEQAHKVCRDRFVFDGENPVGIIAMPSSKDRSVQPVHEIAKALKDKMGVKWSKNLLAKGKTEQMKDKGSFAEKYNLLKGKFSITQKLQQHYDVILLDDLFDTGATLKSAIETLEKCPQIGKIYALTMTRTKKA